MKIISQTFFCLAFFVYISSIIKTDRKMTNVKELLKSWKHDLAHADGLLGTDYETLNEQEFESLADQIEDLERAIKRDESWKQEESEFNDSLNVQRFTL